MDGLDVFHPERMASRILGMGDVISLVERAQQQFDEEEARKVQKKIAKNQFGFDDFLKQIQQIKKMGSMSSIVKMVPGMSGVEVGDKEEKKMARTEAIILSMTRQERRAPRLLRGCRLSRIAKGSGTQVRDVNALLKQFSQMQKMMRMMKGSKGKRLMSEMKNKLGDSPNSSLFQ